MKDKIKKILEIIISVIAIIWIGSAYLSYYFKFVDILAVVVMWGIGMYLLRKK